MTSLVSDLIMVGEIATFNTLCTDAVGEPRQRGYLLPQVEQQDYGCQLIGEPWLRWEESEGHLHIESECSALKDVALGKKPSESGERAEAIASWKLITRSFWEAPVQPRTLS
jgi:hypothetical protein